MVTGKSLPVLSLFSSPKWLILFICAVAILGSFLICDTVYEQLPHTEDEISYLWQARTFAEGKLFIPSPPHAENMFVPFVVDYQGKRFSKYTPGWPLVLSLGVRLGLASWVNPLLAGVSVGLVYLLGKRLMDETTGLIAAALMATSPFFLLNSGSFLSSNLSLALTGAFALAWLKSFSGQDSGSPGRYALVAGLCLGWLALTRPLTTFGMSLPFGIHGLILLWRGDWKIRRRVLLVGGLTTVLASLLLVWQYAATGNFFLNPYTLWWPFDKIGFGKGIGISPQGHQLKAAFENTFAMLDVARRDVFGWGKSSWVLLPFGIWAFRRNRTGWTVTAIFLSLVLTYMVYWAYVTRYGPRYYYDGLYSLTLLSATGIVWLAGKNKYRWAFAALLTCGLVGYNLCVYLPARLDSARAIYGITRAQLTPFQTPQVQHLTPALVLVSVSKKNVYGNLAGDWPQYGGLLELQNPDLTSPFIFALSRGDAEDEALIRNYPGRQVIYYDPGEPEKLSSTTRELSGGEFIRPALQP